MLPNYQTMCQYRDAMRHRSTPSSFASGIRAGIPVLVGYIPAGITFGILAAESGTLLADTLGFSGLVFAGASQFMAVNLIASGDPRIRDYR